MSDVTTMYIRAEANGETFPEVSFDIPGMIFNKDSWEMFKTILPVAMASMLNNRKPTEEKPEAKDVNIESNLTVSI